MRVASEHNPDNPVVLRLLLEEENGFTEVACWMHARRKFFELHKSMSSPACELALTEIAKL